MDEEFYFMALAGLGVSLAGFAGLISALDRQPRQPAIAAWRIRNIVIGGFIVTFGGFLVVALYTLTRDDLTLTVRLSSLALAVANLLHLSALSRPGPAWPSERGRRVAIGGDLALSVGYAWNVLFGGLGLLQLLFLLQLLRPASIFFNTIRDVTGAETEQDGGDG